MFKYWQLVNFQSLLLQNEGSHTVSDGGQLGQSSALLTNTSNVSDGDDIGLSNALVPITSSSEQQWGYQACSLSLPLSLPWTSKVLVFEHFHTEYYKFC